MGLKPGPKDCKSGLISSAILAPMVDIVDTEPMHCLR